MSAKTGRAPVSRTAAAVAAKVNDGMITSSAGPMPRASMVSHKADVPELTATQQRPPAVAENSSSKAATSRPWTRRPECRTRTAAAMSAASRCGAAMGITWFISGPSGAPRRPEGRRASGFGDWFPAVLEIGGGAACQGAGAGVQAPDHVRGEQVLPLAGAGEPPFGMLVAVQAQAPGGVVVGEDSAVERVVG